MIRFLIEAVSPGVRVDETGAMIGDGIASAQTGVFFEDGAVAGSPGKAGFINLRIERCYIVAWRSFLSAKIHGATITDAKLTYQGSLSIDTELLEVAGILPFERVDVYNLDNGERLTTYAIVGGPGEICLNGAAAHRGEIGQRIIIATYQWVEESEASTRAPHVVIVNEDNRVAETIDYPIGPGLQDQDSLNPAYDDSRVPSPPG